MNDKVNIVLIGMPGCGKSTLGKALAKRLGRDFYDADDVIVEQEGKTIPELFAISEDCFRDAESGPVIRWLPSRALSLPVAVASSNVRKIWLF